MTSTPQESNRGRKKDVIFMGEKRLGFDCLKYLYQMENVNILAICTRKETNVWWGKQYVREFAKKEGIPIVRKRDIPKYDHIDFIMSVLYPFIIEKEIIKKAKIATINLHQAPLPEYKGCNATSHAIINGEKYFGGTLHLMTEDLDSGDIIEKRTFRIDDKLTAKELYELNDTNCLNIFKDHIKKVLDNSFNTSPQDKNIKSYIYTRDSLKNKMIQLDWPMEKIWNFVRGNEFPPFEPAYINYNGRKICLLTKTWESFRWQIS